MDASEETTLTFRLPSKLKRDLAAEARAQERTTSQLLRLILLERSKERRKSK